MFANILVIALLALWTIIAVAFIVKNVKSAVVNRNPACLGCSQGCASHPAHCKHRLP